MSSFGSQIRKRVRELNMAKEDVRSIIDKVAEAATIQAVEVATKNTPPNGAAIAGTNTRTGNMAQAWALDSVTKPVRGKTLLANNVTNERGTAYASYVNDGHRMDRHFVPGLIINGDHLEKSPDGSGGIVVGTKTTYVKGLYMKEKAIGRYRSVVRRMLEEEVRKVFEKK
jgi:hypothetical protein